MSTETETETESESEFRAGFACFVGRPNVGKSTLTNAIVGEKVAITSNRPQTTRRAIRGIVHRQQAQLVLVDTPGLHRPRTLLGQRLDDVVRETWSQVDVIAMCIPANESIGPGDRFIAGQLAEARVPVLAVVTKVDLVNPSKLAGQLLAVGGLADFAEIVPLSAKSGEQVELLVDLLVKRLPLSPPLYPADMTTDEPQLIRIAELIREAALEGVRDELPHSIAVTIEEILPHEGRNDMLDVHAVVHVERPSQKAIVLGHHGERMKYVGTTARAGIEKLLGSKIYLDLHITVDKDWQRDPKKLARLGF